MNRYIISFDPARISTGTKIFDAFLSNHKYIKSWSSPFSGTYFLKSENSIEDLQPAFDEIFEKRRYLILKISTGYEETNGRMPNEIWEWLKKDED